MDPIRSAAPQPAPATGKPPEKPQADAAPAPAGDQATIGKGGHEDHPSLGYRLARGAAGFVGGAASGVVSAGLGAVRHAGDLHAVVPRPVNSLVRIAGAAAGLVLGPVAGMALLGPIGLPLGLVAGPILGAYTGGKVTGGAEAAVDAAAGGVQGGRAGFHAGYNYAAGLVDAVAGHPSHGSKPPAGHDPPDPKPAAPGHPPS